jgi:hypothetical protein
MLSSYLGRCRTWNAGVYQNAAVCRAGTQKSNNAQPASVTVVVPHRELPRVVKGAYKAELYAGHDPKDLRQIEPVDRSVTSRARLVRMLKKASCMAYG